MTLLKDFRETYSEDTLGQTLERAGLHGNGLGTPPPYKKRERLAYALLEVLDFECNKYGDYGLVTDEQIKEILLRNRKEVTAMKEITPSYMGLMCGVFNFLTEETVKVS